MENYTFQKDVHTYAITASSFPDGIEQAHLDLHARLPKNERRQFFGVSWPDENGHITYKAAASIMEDDGPIEGLDIFTIKNGPYNTFYIKDYRKHTESIAEAFNILTKQHEVDPSGYCLEWYINENDVKCLVPLGNNYREFTGLNKE